ncbi:MAG: helix-turn-helix domain-containing protein [Lactobacillales bacterium]|jgi:hypothetical protein|nr:helix-turn-helix domain-containing protein [Lactobacillales bacterium]
MKMPAYYGILPACVRYDGKLSPSAKVLFTDIAALCRLKGFCGANNAYFSKLYNVSRASISNWVAELVGAGYIESEKSNTGRRLKIVDTPHQENFKQDNTYTKSNIYKKKKIYKRKKGAGDLGSESVGFLPLISEFEKQKKSHEVKIKADFERLWRWWQDKRGGDIPKKGGIVPSESANVCESDKICGANQRDDAWIAALSAPVSKKQTYDLFLNLIFQGENHETIINGARRYVKYCASTGIVPCALFQCMQDGRYRVDYAARGTLGPVCSSRSCDKGTSIAEIAYEFIQGA